MRKARAEYRIPAFYLVNAVCHAAKTKLKDNKDQYVKRFMEKGMPGFESLSECDDSEKKQIAKVKPSVIFKIQIRQTKVFHMPHNFRSE